MDNLMYPTFCSQEKMNVLATYHGLIICHYTLCHKKFRKLSHLSDKSYRSVVSAQRIRTVHAIHQSTVQAAPLVHK